MHALCLWHKYTNIMIYYDMIYFRNLWTFLFYFMNLRVVDYHTIFPSIYILCQNQP